MFNFWIEYFYIHSQTYVSGSFLLDMPNYCLICGLSKAKDPSISLYSILESQELRKKWLDGLRLTHKNLSTDGRVCSKHFVMVPPKPFHQLM
jgi:hypothetical protein